MVTVTAQAQTTWYVDDDALGDPGPGDPTVSDPLEDGSADHPFDAIQEAIDTAVDADTVLVLDGTYTGEGNRDLNFRGRLITVRSENGPGNCTIDCEGDGRGFYFHSGEGPDSIVEGLTITNGYVDGGSPGGGGAGVCCYGSGPTLTNCTITANTANGYDGGAGVFCHWNSSPTLTNCRITANTAPAAAGAGVVCSWDSSPTLTNCTIAGNTGESGAGVSCSDSSPTLTNCTISDNIAGAGAGVWCADSSPTLTNCTISGNTARWGHGGGVGCARASPTLTNCIIAANTADFGGGGVSCHWDSPTLANCTIILNTAPEGGSVWCWDSSPTLTNCILWNDSPQEIYVHAGNDPIATYCDVQGGWPGEGNIDADPLCVDPNNGDFHLSAGSSCIDAGDNTAVPPWLLTDLDGNPRLVDDAGMPDDGFGTSPIVDMGAYEFQGETCFGDLDGDYDIDLADLATLLAHYETTGTVYTDGDLDRDEDVDLSDLAALLAVYGTTCE
jgi:hypothetical protein